MSFHCKIGGPHPSELGSVLDLSRGLEDDENRAILESNPPDYLHLDIIDGYMLHPLKFNIKFSVK